MQGARVGAFESRLARHSAKPVTAGSRSATKAEYNEDAISKLKYDALLSARHHKVKENPGPITNKLYQTRKAGAISALPPLPRTASSYDRFSCSKNITQQVNILPRSRGVPTKPSISAPLLPDTKREKEMNRNGISRPKSAFPRQSTVNYVTSSGKPLNQGLSRKVRKDTGKLNSCHQSNLSQQTEITIIVDEHKDRMVAENCLQLGSIGCTEKCLRWLQGL